MATQDFSLRPHHLLNLVQGYKDGYESLANGLRNTFSTESNSRAYRESDADASQAYYLSVASDPANRITIVSGIDDVCRLCSNFDGSRCTLFREDDLAFEDRRTLYEIFDYLRIGQELKAADIIASK